MKKQAQGILYLFICTIIWGNAFIAQSVGMERIGPFTFQAARCVLAVLFLIPLSFIVEFRQGFAESFRRWKNPRLWKTGIICGVALFIAANLQQVGLVYTDAGKAGFLTAMYIVIVPILGIFLHRKPPKTAIISVVIAVAGLYMLSCMGVSQINIGDVYLVGCAFAFSVQIMLIDNLAGDLDGIRLNCIQALMVVIFSTPVALASEHVRMENILYAWLPIGFAGVFSMGLAYTFQIMGQKNVEPTTASLIMSLESVFAALGGWLILHETMTGFELTGCALVFAAVIISQIPVKQ